MTAGMMEALRCRLAVGMFILVLTGCGGGYAPVTDPVTRTTPSASKAPGPAPVPESGEYRVSRGDTLYAIAWRYGLDYRDVAQWNDIRAPYTIYPGDRIRLQAPAQPARQPSAAVTRSKAASRSDSPSAPLPKSAPNTGKPPGTVPSPPLPRTMPSPPIDTTARKTDAPKPGPPHATDTDIAMRKPAETPSAPAESLPKGPITWQWPTKGSLIRMQSPTAEKGIKLSGRVGQPIQAAAPGQVVYSGSGLIGYGKLIIIKHNDTYLSAYAHNSELLVNEGDSVTSGQQIATMGTGADGRAALHFEIRRNGQPIDPLKHLPQRQG